MFKFFKCDKDNEKSVEQFFKIMDKRSVRKEITKNGDVQIISVNDADQVEMFGQDDELKKEEKSNQDGDITIKIFGCIFENQTGKIYNLEQELDFDQNARLDVHIQLDKIKSRLEDQRESAQQQLDLLPQNL